MRVTNCQRWRARRDLYRPAGEPVDPARHEVALIPDDNTAKAFVTEHHYSGTYPAARLRVGLFRAGVGLAGVAVFSVPCNPRTVTKWTGLEPRAGVELGRFVLLDLVEANGETWFLARALRLLRQALPEVQAVVSFSDPVPRRSSSGRLVLPGHVGTIYQAGNGRYCGRGKRELLTLRPDGQVLNRRSLSKVRNEERGASYAYEQLLAAGAPRRRPGEVGRAYVTRALAEGPFRRVRHPGNHVYTWALTRRVRLPRPALPYPKEVDHAA